MQRMATLAALVHSAAPMPFEVLVLALLIAAGLYLLNAQAQRRRIALLASHLGNYQIEKLMETLTQGYLRALGENDPERRTQIWSLLQASEARLSDQFGRFAAEFARVDAAQARVSKLPLALPLAEVLLPSATFDVRRAFEIHAHGFAAATREANDSSPRDKAFTLSAELLLMQHTCHWFCKSRMVASARMLARHQTAYAQLVASVAPETRRAYCTLVGAGG